MKSIGVLNLTRFGDLVQTSPLLGGLRKRHPEAELHLIVKKRFASVARMLPGPTRIHEIDGAAIVRTLHDPALTFVERFRRVRSALAPLRELRFDRLFNLTHSRSSAVLLSLLEAETPVGYTLDREGHRAVCSPWLLHVGTVVRARRLMRTNLVDIYLGAGDLLGQGEPLAVHVPEDARRYAAEALAEEGARIAVQLGASDDNKTWPVAAYAETLRTLHELIPELRVLLVGVEAEAPRAHALIDACPSLAFENGVGQTSVAELAALLERADLLLTGDTGTMHLAAAVGTRICAVFVGVGHPYETAPYGEGHWVVHSRVECAPCQLDLRCGHTVCHTDIPPHWLARLLRRILCDERPEEIEPLARADLLRTRFDEDGLLELVPAHVRPATPADLCAIAYRDVFLASLAGQPARSERTWRRIARHHDLPASEIPRTIAATTTSAVSRLCEVGTEAAGEADRLVRSAGDPSRVRAIGARLAELDERVLAVGRAEPLLAPLALSFESGMESVGEGSLVEVALASADEYRRLAARATHLGQILRGPAGAAHLEGELR